MVIDERPAKKTAFDQMLLEGWVSLHFDGRKPGVIIPERFRNDAHMVLQYGREMPIAIDDMAVNDDGVTATLSFSREPHRTFVPWSAVYAVACTTGEGILYREDVPADVVLNTGGDKRPILASVPADDSGTPDDEPPTRTGKPTLTIVK